MSDRIQELFAELSALAKTAEEDYDSNSQELIARMAMRLYHESAYKSDMQYRATISWHDGCSCHGTSRSENLVSDSPAGLASQVADHEHGVRRDGQPYTDEQPLFTLALSEEENKEFDLAFFARIAENKAAASKAAELKLANERKKALAASVKRAQDDLAAHRHELTYEAIAAREAEIKTLQTAM